MNYPEILELATNRATKAIRDKFDRGDREGAFNCGFAWVNVDGRDPFVKWCKTNLVKLDSANYRGDRKFGSPGYPKGWSFWGPGEWPTREEMGFPVYTQDMDFKYAAAQAFADTLRENGIKVTSVGQRLD